MGMNDKATIYTAFINAKRAFGPALKEKTNPAFRSKYADLGACINAVDDALLENGIALIQETFIDDTGVTIETVFLHESGESIRGGKLHVPASKQDPQGYGSALSYARRYSLQTACGIAPEDDDGNAASGKDKPAASEKLQAKAKADAPIPVNENEMTITLDLLAGAENVEKLQAVFSAIWKRATKEQQGFLKPAYDNRKSQLQSASFGEQA